MVELGKRFIWIYSKLCVDLCAGAGCKHQCIDANEVLSVLQAFALCDIKSKQKYLTFEMQRNGDYYYYIIEYERGKKATPFSGCDIYNSFCVSKNTTVAPRTLDYKNIDLREYRFDQFYIFDLKHHVFHVALVKTLNEMYYSENAGRDFFAISTALSCIDDISLIERLTCHLLALLSDANPQTALDNLDRYLVSLVGFLQNDLPNVKKTVCTAYTRLLRKLTIKNPDRMKLSSSLVNNGGTIFFRHEARISAPFVEMLQVLYHSFSMFSETTTIPQQNVGIKAHFEDLLRIIEIKKDIPADFINIANQNDWKKTASDYLRKKSKRINFFGE